MPAPYARMTAARRWVTLVTYITMLAGIGTIIAPLLLGRTGFDTLMPYIAAGIALVVVGAMFSGLCALLFKVEADAHRIHELLIDSRATQEKDSAMMETVRDNSQISDAARSITHRELEREALRKAIREDIVKEDWEAAYNLIEEMETRFGYRLEAYNYRKDVDEFRAKVIEDKLQTSLRHVRILIDQKNWTEAGAEIERLLKLSPKDDRVSEAISMLNTKKDQHKKDLLQHWHQAVEKKDLDRAIDMIKVMDPYLTREEVAKLEDSARSVFKAKLLDHAAQFRAAVTEKRWQDAINIGEQIRQEFPNSLMAKEVSDSMEALKAKAARPAASMT